MSNHVEKQYFFILCEDFSWHRRKPLPKYKAHCLLPWNKTVGTLVTGAL